jgi:hypothetical protein
MQEHYVLYAPNGVTVDKTIGEGWTGTKYAKTAVVNSGMLHLPISLCLQVKVSL